jgi:hypothetical protein
MVTSTTLADGSLDEGCTVDADYQLAGIVDVGVGIWGPGASSRLANQTRRWVILVVEV